MFGVGNWKHENLVRERGRLFVGIKLLWEEKISKLQSEEAIIRGPTEVTRNS